MSLYLKFKEDLYWAWRNHVGRHFSKVFCWMWGHPEEEMMVIEMFGKTVLEACVACGRKTFEACPCD